ncbi:hypothetical protein OK074_2544 [Actinobacteria bacterium OK074]|nr:hypothetical protein OK074_2544 [Actinobacteria bacterium OK074]
MHGHPARTEHGTTPPTEIPGCVNGYSADPPAPGVSKGPAGRHNEGSAGRRDHSEEKDMEAEMEAEAEYGFVVSLDAQGSGLLSDSEKQDMRKRLYDVSGRAFEEAGIRAPRLYQEDRGDGILSFLRPSVKPVRVVGTWLVHLNENLRQSNTTAKVPLRLRAGLHVGPIAEDEHGRSGQAIDLACRLGDCDIAKGILKAAPETSPLVVAVSGQLYDDVVQHGGRWVEPEHYGRYEVDLKEGRRTAWFMVPGLPQPPRPDAKPAAGTGTGTGAAPKAKGGARVTNTAYSYGSGQIFQGERFDTININQPPSSATSPSPQAAPFTPPDPAAPDGAE